MADLRKRVLQLVRERGYQRREEPFRLASGQMSHDYVDGKRAIASGEALLLVAEAACLEVSEEFDAVGGLTMGADPVAHAIAIYKRCDWFSVRKEPKGRGLDKWIEGASLGEGSRVLLVDDVVTTGGSIFQAHERVRETGAALVAALTLVDRGDAAAVTFRARGVPYYALVTYDDLGIQAVGSVYTAVSSV